MADTLDQPMQTPAPSGGAARSMGQVCTGRSHCCGGHRFVRIRRRLVLAAGDHSSAIRRYPGAGQRRASRFSPQPCQGRRIQWNLFQQWQRGCTFQSAGLSIGQVSGDRPIRNWRVLRRFSQIRRPPFAAWPFRSHFPMAKNGDRV